MADLERVTLDFADAPKKARESRLADISAVTACDGDLFLASDETSSVERLSPSPDGGCYEQYQQFDLEDFVELKTDASVEVDIEGLDVEGPYLWVVGSHSLKRVKPNGAPDEDAIIELSRTYRETNRYLLARIPYLRGADGRAGLHRRIDAGGKVRAAAQLFGTSKSNMLVDALRDDEHLGRFLAIPAKENGFDIEGLAVLGKRLFLGLRGPVLGGWAVVLEIEVEEISETFLRLLPIGKDRALYRKHFVDLGGLGIRELCRDGDDLLILAGPTMDLDGRVLVRRWKDARKNRKQTVIAEDELEDVLDVPFDPSSPGREHPEGMCLLERGGAHGLLVVYDAPAEDRLTKTSTAADFFPLR